MRILSPSTSSPRRRPRPSFPLSRVFDQALEGGGAKNINFQEVAADLAQITFDYPFRIPPYFALIIRAIGVLEGIALVGNPDFALVDEAYPYISKRLLTDDSPRLRESLRYMVYGKGQVFDADRLIDVLEAFETFRAASRTSQGDFAREKPPPALHRTRPKRSREPPRVRRGAPRVSLPGDRPSRRRTFARQVPRLVLLIRSDDETPRRARRQPSSPRGFLLPRISAGRGCEGTTR